MATKYGSFELGNGDPVFIVYRDNVRGSWDVSCLGTGFESIEQIEQYVNRSDEVPPSATDILVMSNMGELDPDKI